MAFVSKNMVPERYIVAETCWYLKFLVGTEIPDQMYSRSVESSDRRIYCHPAINLKERRQKINDKISIRLDRVASWGGMCTSRGAEGWIYHS